MPDAAAAGSRRTPFRPARPRTGFDYFAEIGSTNDRAIALALERRAGGHRRAGRHAARRARPARPRVVSRRPAPGSTCRWSLRPAGPRRWTLVTLAAGVAAARAVTGATGLPVELKWPNDLVDRASRGAKLGGVLCESVGSGATRGRRRRRHRRQPAAGGVSAGDRARGDLDRNRARARRADRGAVVAALLVGARSRHRHGCATASAPGVRRVAAAGGRRPARRAGALARSRAATAPAVVRGHRRRRRARRRGGGTGSSASCREK